MKGLFLKYYQDNCVNVVFLKMSSYRFQGDSDVDCSNENDYTTSEETSRRVLLCKCCGANDWSYNGITINEYECSCCGQFVEVYEKQ